MAGISLEWSAETGLRVEDLALRMPHASGVIDPEPFRARARGEGPALPEPFDVSGGMRCLYLPDGGIAADLFDRPEPVLTFVISGSVEIESDNRGMMVVVPGDVFLASGLQGVGKVHPGPDCRLVQVLVEPDWPGAKARPVRPPQAHPRGDRPCNFKRMAKGDDNRSRFHLFETLFARPGRWSAITPLVGFRFIGMLEDTFIDWHPEVVNNLVIVMSGALELEVGGTPGGVEVFRQGDICLAEDRTGEGHIDRVHGYVQVAVLILDDADLWPADG